jgi:hypothetical protein
MYGDYQTRDPYLTLPAVTPTPPAGLLSPAADWSHLHELNQPMDKVRVSGHIARTQFALFDIRLSIHSFCLSIIAHSLLIYLSIPPITFSSFHLSFLLSLLT